MVDVDNKEEEERAKEILLRNYRILEIGSIDKANPTNISLNNNRDVDYSKNDGYFNYFIHGNTLAIDFWSNNYAQGIELISIWWAITAAESIPHDNFNQNRGKLYLRAFLPLIFAFISTFGVILGSLHFAFPLTGIILSTFLFWKLRGQTSEWRMRLKTRVRENLSKVNFDLSETDLVKRIDSDCDSLFSSKMAYRLGGATNIIQFVVLIFLIFGF